MPATKRIVAAAAVASAAMTGLGAGPAGADPTTAWGINGTYATSVNGDWAKVNERYEDQPSERQTWTVTTQCVSPTDCSGTVNSDAGWSAPIYTVNSLYYVKRAVPQWRFCADGTPIEGLQVYKLYPVGFDGHVDLSSSEYTGEQQTTGPSGSCGRNQWPAIRAPFYMKKI
ncbi:Rv2253/PknI dimerization domain-containing protein [Mycobacterium sp. NPDC003449]